MKVRCNDVCGAGNNVAITRSATNTIYWAQRKYTEF